MCSLYNFFFIFQKQQSSIKLVVNGSLPFLGMDIIRNQERMIYEIESPIHDPLLTKIILNLFFSPGHNQIWICNFLQCDWSRPQPKH